MNKVQQKQPNVFESIRLKHGLKRPGMAKLLGTTQQQVYQLERRNGKITTEWLNKYALALNIPVTDIMSNKETINLDMDVVSISNTQSIPVYGMAAAGDPELVAINEDSIIEHVPFYWPTGMKAPKDAFGVTVRGESMLPRFLPNEVVVVDPHMAPRKNSECVVEMVSSGAFVKIYLGRFADKYHFSQYNTDILPDGKDNLIIMDVRQVKRVCAVIGHIMHR
jgi:phage repressor protein C with HTH and peptisase S24 domain